MKRTNKYQMGYFEQGDLTSSVIEKQRWTTLDNQLSALFSIFGNGIWYGWELIRQKDTRIGIANGVGFVNSVCVSSDDISTLPLADGENYIYAYLAEDSYWNQTVVFRSTQTRNPFEENESAVYLGSAYVSNDEVVDINRYGVQYISFQAIIRDFVRAHRHIGGINNPSQIDLSTDVQGVLNQRNMPDFDASKILTGTISRDRLPLIDHIKNLKHQGSLTHSQIDSFIEALNFENASLMGEISTIDLLQLILALKHVYPDIDEFLLNQIAYIPGISPDDYVDWDNTTADVDTKTAAEGGTHTISGHPVPGIQEYTNTWKNKKDFDSWKKWQIFTEGDQACLETTETIKNIDDFSDLSQWEVITEDLSSLAIALSSDSSTFVSPNNSAILKVQETAVELALVIKKDFDAQDWSPYKKLIFYIKTDSVQHGDIYFYLNDAIAGTQDSHTKILSRNTPTINVDTLKNGWQEVTIDIENFERNNINSMGFYVSSQKGWDTSKGFNLNLDDIYLTTGFYYRDHGYVRVIFGNDDFDYKFKTLRWEALVPSDVQSTGISLRGRTRVGNSMADIENAPWGPWINNGDDVVLPDGAMYKYIEIDMYFQASINRSRTPYLKKIHIDYEAPDVENSFNYDSQNNWESGQSFNIDLKTKKDSISISGVDNVGKIIYGSENKIVKLDENMTKLYDITGSMLPKTTAQCLYGKPSSFGLISGVARGDHSNVWISDIDNDRVVEINKDGNLIRGFYGSFLQPPLDFYGTEEFGPGSNTDISPYVPPNEEGNGENDELPIERGLKVLHSLYNAEEGNIYIVFDKDLENIYANDTNLDINKIYLKIGTQRFYLNDSHIELMGVEKDKYERWYDLTSDSTSEAGKFINQFKFNSHVLKIKLQGANKSILDHMVLQKAPSIITASPLANELTEKDVEINFILHNFELNHEEQSSDSSENINNVIMVKIDDNEPIYINETKLYVEDLEPGKHTVQAQLVGDDGMLLENIEAITHFSFVVNDDYENIPILTIVDPKPNQIYSASPITVNFHPHNFPIVSGGQHIKYFIDGGAIHSHFSNAPIEIYDLSNGKHTLTMYLVDDKGNELEYDYGRISVDFIIGLNSKADLKLYVNENAIKCANKELTTLNQIHSVNVSNVFFRNIYSPIDIQMVSDETSRINPQGTPSIVIAKLRSPSWTNGMGSLENQEEMIRRLNQEGGGQEETLMPDTPTSNLIYGTNYLDGHSVVQMDMHGNIMMSNNAAVFAMTKEEAKKILGSAEKIGENEFLIADAINKRAIITYTNTENQNTQVQWEYETDRYISDFHITWQDDIVIKIRDDAIENSFLEVRQGSVVIWENASSKPITIYSGSTSPEQFDLDPDLTLYGSSFKSETINPGDRFSFRMINYGKVDWVVYPDILTGKIMVTKNRISSRDQFIILENDGLNSPFSSRVIKTDSWGNVLMSFGEGYMVNPRDARPLRNNKILIST